MMLRVMLCMLCMMSMRNVMYEHVRVYCSSFMTRIVNGEVVKEEATSSSKSGPIGFVISLIQSLINFIKLFLASIFNPRSLTNSYRRPPPGGGGGGPKRPTVIHRIKMPENCRAGS